MGSVHHALIALSSGRRQGIFSGLMRTIFLLAVVAAPLAAQADTTVRPASVGVYTDSEAVLGESVYLATCSACHTQSDQSGPQFKLNWFGKTIFDYVLNLKTTMPDDNPGGLSDDEYRRVTAYILKLNGFRPGPAPLPTDTAVMKLIRIDSVSSDTTKPPADTTKPPADTTKPPADTTKPPADTTKPPADTTKPPANTTKRPRSRR